MAYFKKKGYHQEFNIRRSQLLTPFGIGALTDVNNQSLMISDSEYWDLKKCVKVHDVRLEKVMGADGFIEPPENGEVEAKRFPSWYFSPVDRSLKKINDWKSLIKDRDYIDLFNRQPFDPRENKWADLVPVRVICVCSNGHVQDFPWLEWVHENKRFEEYKKHEIKLISRHDTGSIGDLLVYCEDCKRSKSLTGIFNDTSFSNSLEVRNVCCKGQYHWKKNESRKKCDEPLKALLKNATNFYFSNISTSVNIPFKENRIMECIMEDQHYDNLANVLRTYVDKEKIDEAKEDFFVKGTIQQISKNTNYSIEEITKTIFNKFFNEHDIVSEDENVMDYRKAEFEVLTGEKEFDIDSNRFSIDVFDNDSLTSFNFGQLFSKVTLVHQLEVVSALRSYTRLEATDSDLMKEKMLEGEQEFNEVFEVSLRRRDNYYVGMRSLGEGIFISLDTNKIKEWVQKINSTSIGENIYKKIKRTSVDNESEYITPEFYLLHTLSHLLIKELGISCGYSSSALKERLYYSNNDYEMYGILIYTSSSDSEGTLGGLVKQGIPRKLFEILDNAIEKAKWCSFDPICIESDSQGRDSLNSAACHACSLISETSCENMNVFLDRRMLIGSLENPSLGFFTGV